MNALLLQIISHPPFAQLLILLAQPRISLGKGRVVQVAVLAQPRQSSRNGSLFLQGEKRLDFMACAARIHAHNPL